MNFRIENLTETEGFKLIFELTTVKEMHLFNLASYENHEYGGIFSDFIEEHDLRVYNRTCNIVDDNLVTVSFDFYTITTGGGRVFNSDDSDAIKTANFIQEWMDEEKLNKSVYYTREY